MWVSLDDEWILGGIGVKGDTADDSRVGDLLAVLLGLDGRVEQIPQQCQAEAEQQTEHHAEGQVARRLGADRRGGDGGGTHDGHLHRAGLAFGHTLQVCDGLGELNADSVRDLRGHAGVGVRDGDLDQNGVERHRCGDLGSEGCRVRVELQRLDHGIEDARSRDDVRVGQDTLLGEVATRQKCAAVTVRWRRRAGSGLRISWD